MTIIVNILAQLLVWSVTRGYACEEQCLSHAQSGTALRLRPISLWRRGMNALVTLAAGAAVVLVLVPLGAIFGYLIYKGMGSINWAFLTQTPKPVGEAGGGMANAIAGSVYILGIASVMGVPIGIGAGIYLAEYGRNRFGNLIRFTADVLNGVPSIVVGIVAYGIVVLRRDISRRWPAAWRWPS